MSTISAAPPERVRPVTEHPSLLQLFRMSLRTEKAAVRPLLLGAGTCLALLFLLFWPNLRHFVYTWSTDENYSHGFLVPLIALYFANEAARRGPVPLRGGVVLGMVLLLLAILGRVATIFVPVGIVGDLSFLLGLAGTCAPVRRPGRVAALRLRPGVPGLHDPAADRPVHRDRLSVAALVSLAASNLLNALDIPVLCQGNVMTLPGGVQMFVAEACSGMRQLTGFLALTTAVAYLTTRPLWYRAGGGRLGHPDRHDRQRDPRRGDRGDHVPRRSPVRPGLLPHGGGHADDGPGPGLARRPLYDAGMGRSAGARTGRVADGPSRHGRTHRPGGQPAATILPRVGIGCGASRWDWRPVRAPSGSSKRRRPALRADLDTLPMSSATGWPRRAGRSEGSRGVAGRRVPEPDLRAPGPSRPPDDALDQLLEARPEPAALARSLPALGRLGEDRGPDARPGGGTAPDGRTTLTRLAYRQGELVQEIGFWYYIFGEGRVERYVRSLPITSRSSHGRTTRGSGLTVEVFCPGEVDPDGEALQEFASALLSELGHFLPDDRAGYHVP